LAQVSAADSPLVYDADFEEVADQRRGDRRQLNRRADKPRFNTLFAATLVNHVAIAERTAIIDYPTPARACAGIAFDLRA
jgi:hypothetical protein